VLVPYEQAYGEGFDDMKRRVPDISRALALLQWRPQRTLDEIILELVGWPLQPAQERLQLLARVS